MGTRGRDGRGSPDTVIAPGPVPDSSRSLRPGAGLIGPGIAVAYLGIVVILPVAALVFTSLAGGLDAFLAAITQPANVAALLLTLFAAFIVVVIDALMGTLIAWILVRDDFPGKRSVNALIDLPFALPTVVAGLTLLTLYGPESPVRAESCVHSATQPARLSRRGRRPLPDVTWPTAYSPPAIAGTGWPTSHRQDPLPLDGLAGQEVSAS